VSHGVSQEPIRFGLIPTAVGFEARDDVGIDSRRHRLLRPIELSDINSFRAYLVLSWAPPTSLSPSFGPTGTVVTITGVRVKSRRFKSAALTAGSIVAQVPPTLALGLFNVQVVNSAGSSNTQAFRVTGAGCPAN
jgi:hypothetical protein